MSTTEILLIVNLVVTLLVAVLVLVRVKSRGDVADWKSDFTIFGAELGKVGPLLREELTRSREEEQRTARDTRAELASSVKSLSDSLSQQFQNLLNQLGTQGTGLADRLAALATTNEDKFEKLILANDANLKDFREQLLNMLKTHREEAAQSATERQVAITTSLKAFEDRFAQNVKDFNATLEKTRESMVSTLDRMREVTAATLEKNREVMVNTLETTRQTVENRLDKTRETVESRLGVLQEENNKKLEEMRATVDEKLQTSVEKRFNESFKLISERLDQVHKGLGEMQTLASGVGDLKKVLTNVKTRGNLGEVQLGAILEEIFSVDQYEQNVSVKAGSQERVEFAIKLPGKNDDNQPLLLPIDSKFPNEDYQRLIDAYENVGDLDGKTIEAIGRQFENAVRKCAKDINDKYIQPPATTDFAILFVPTEGLYAEILRRPGLFDALRRDLRVIIVGPTNLVAFLSSLQMGFRTLAIEKRSSEVWAILGAVKNEFSLFGTVLANTKKKLEQAAKTIDAAGVRTRAIERHLRKVEELPKEQAVELIGMALEMEAEDLKDEEKETGE